MPHALGRRSLLSRRHDQPNHHHHLETPRSGPWPRFRFTSSIHPGPSVMHPTVWRTNVTGACTNSRPSKTAQRSSACFFARRPQEHLRRIPLFPWTAARIREIQSWRWPQPEVMLQKSCCKMNIVTKFSKLSCFIYWFIRVSFYFIYSFILHSHHLKDFFVFFFSCFRRAPRSGFSSCWAILKIYISQSVSQSDFEKQWKVMSQATGVRRLCCRVCRGLVSERSPSEQLLWTVRRQLASGRMSDGGGLSSARYIDNVARHTKAPVNDCKLWRLTCQHADLDGVNTTGANSYR